MTISGDEPPVGLPHRPISEPGPPVLPAGACDCHFHVIAPDAPLVSPRSYTPVPASLADWRRMADRVGIARGVVVQPSVYGQDNSVLLRALASAPDRLRGIVVIPPDTGEAELTRLDALGVRGVRINLRNPGGLAPESVAELAARIAPVGWHLQFQIGPDQIGDIDALLTDLAVPAVIDHCAFIDVSDPDRRAAGLADLKSYLDGQDRYVKLSAPYRLAASPGHAGFAELALDLARSHPHRLLWATDWPHTETFDAMPDDLVLAKEALGWFADEGAREAVMVSTPNRLYWT